MQGCTIINGVETCFCEPGYKLDMDNTSCIGMVIMIIHV